MKCSPLPGQVTLCLTWFDIEDLCRLLQEAIHSSDLTTILLFGKNEHLCQQVQQLWQRVTQSLSNIHLLSSFQEGSFNEAIEIEASFVLLSSHLNLWLLLEPITPEELTLAWQVANPENDWWRVTITFDQSAITTFLAHPTIATLLPADRDTRSEIQVFNQEERLKQLWLKLFPLLCSNIPQIPRSSDVSSSWALSQTGQFFCSILEETAELFAEFNPELRYVFVNAIGCELLSLPLAEIIGKTNQELIGNAAVGLEQLIRQTFEINEKVFADCEIALPDRDRVFETVCLPVVDTSRVVQRVVCVSRDVTELKQQWHFLATQNQELATAIQQKQEFIAITSHELRAPLTAILGFSNVLRQEFFGELTTKQRDYLDRIHSSGLHLLELINDILDLSRIEANHLELELQPVSVVDICENVLSLIQERATNQGLNIELELTDEFHYIVADPKRLKQMLLNLLTNAVKFTPTGTVGLRVYYDRSEPNSSQASEASLSSAKTAEDDRPLEMIHFLVWDTGIGIDEADQIQLFRPFSQVGDSNFYKQQGTGLGLAITRKLAELHGGSITLRSALGEGAQFTLSLPLHTTRG
jgi:signal transduction histidine kinase